MAEYLNEQDEVVKASIVLFPLYSVMEDHEKIQLFELAINQSFRKLLNMRLLQLQTLLLNLSPKGISSEKLKMQYEQFSDELHLYNEFNAFLDNVLTDLKDKVPGYVEAHEP